MRVLMLGWEFPPRITGGLGTACAGITRGLASRGVDVTFVVPRAQAAGHQQARPRSAPGPRILPVEAHLNPYADPESYLRSLEAFQRRREQRVPRPEELLDLRVRRLYERFPPGPRAARDRRADAAPDAKRGHGLFADVRRFTERAVEGAEAIGNGRFDLIHAHDWMTFPAGQELAGRFDRPLVCHLHASEFDRATGRGDERIHALEQVGLEAADRVVCVSRRTRDLVHSAYHVDAGKLRVVYNGQDTTPGPGLERAAAPEAGAKGAGPRVLFLGRLVRQKAPLVFLDAAARVLEDLPEARFVVAGEGDQGLELRMHARRLGIAERIEFTGFLEPDATRAAFAAADLFVMPSTAEPFGLVALEAASAGCPVILTETSGVAEVLHSARRVPVGDVAATAAAVVELWRDPAERRRMASAARRELAGMAWERRAAALISVYEELAW